MEEEKKSTSFATIYDSFLTRVTSDMYMEMTELDTLEQLQDLLINAIPSFEFPRFDIFDYEEGSFAYIGDYQGVESNGVLVPATGWVGQQLKTTDNTAMQYSGSDSKFTSQAKHMAKLKVLIDKYEYEERHSQRLYKRRIRTEEGAIRSTMGQIMEVPKYGYKI